MGCGHPTRALSSSAPRGWSPAPGHRAGLGRGRGWQPLLLGLGSLTSACRQMPGFPRIHRKQPGERLVLRAQVAEVPTAPSGPEPGRAARPELQGSSPSLRRADHPQIGRAHV